MRVRDEDSVLRTIVDGGLPVSLAVRALMVIELFPSHQAQASAAKKIVATFKEDDKEATATNAQLDEMMEGEVERIRTHPNTRSSRNAVRERSPYGRGC